MWIYTIYGFFSVTQTTLDPEAIQIRARAKNHLLNLKNACKPLAKAKITASDVNDYRFRMIVSRPVWEAVGDQLTRSLDYSNFKGEVQRAGFARDMLDELHRIWSIMFAFQRKHTPGPAELFGDWDSPTADEREEMKGHHKRKRAR